MNLTSSVWQSETFLADPSTHAAVLQVLIEKNIDLRPVYNGKN